MLPAQGDDRVSFAPCTYIIFSVYIANGRALKILHYREDAEMAIHGHNNGHYTCFNSEFDAENFHFHCQVDRVQYVFLLAIFFYIVSLSAICRAESETEANANAVTTRDDAVHGEGPGDRNGSVNSDDWSLSAAEWGENHSDDDHHHLAVNNRPPLPPSEAAPPPPQAHRVVGADGEPALASSVPAMVTTPLPPFVPSSLPARPPSAARSPGPRFRPASLPPPPRSLPPSFSSRRTVTNG